MSYQYLCTLHSDHHNIFQRFADTVFLFFLKKRILNELIILFFWEESKYHQLDLVYEKFIDLCKFFY